MKKTKKKIAKTNTISKKKQKTNDNGNAQKTEKSMKKVLRLCASANKAVCE